MKNNLPIRLLKKGLPVKEVRDAIDRNPQLWNQNTGRTRDVSSPHYGLSDIWARFIPDLSRAHEFQESVWNEEVIGLLPLKDLSEEVLKVFPGKLGSILITKIPSGGLCKPHRDSGWHAEYYQKVAVMIKANDKQAFCFDNAMLISKPGDAFWFDNSHSHWVPNISDEERITAIFCIKPYDK